MKIEVLSVAIPTKHFTVPLPSGKDIIRAVNNETELARAAVYFRDSKCRKDCVCPKCEDANRVIARAVGRE